MKLALLLTFFTNFALATELPIKCTADFSPMALGQRTDLQVVLEKATDGKIYGSVINLQTKKSLDNKNVVVTTYPVTENLDLNKSVNSSDFDKNLNFGEKAILHIQFLLSEKDIVGTMKIPFNLKHVAKVKIYDLEGQSELNKFGGTILIETYNKEDQFLGRALRSVFVAGCF